MVIVVCNCKCDLRVDDIVFRQMISLHYNLNCSKHRLKFHFMYLTESSMPANALTSLQILQVSNSSGWFWPRNRLTECRWNFREKKLWVPNRIPIIIIKLTHTCTVTRILEEEGISIPVHSSKNRVSELPDYADSVKSKWNGSYLVLNCFINSRN